MTQTEFNQIVKDESLKLAVYKTGLELAHRNAEYADAVKIRAMIDESCERLKQAMFTMRGF